MNSLGELLKQVQLMVRAHYPIIAMLSHEEQRCWRLLKQVAAEDGKQLYRWRVSVGLEQGETALADSQNVQSALMMIEKISEPAIFIFHDLQAHINDPVVLRQLRDLSESMPMKQQSIVLLGARLKVPDEIEKSVVLLDVPLPSYSDGARILKILCRQHNIELLPEDFERFVNGALGLTEHEIKRMYARILLGGSGFSASDLSLQLEEKRRAIRRSKFLEFWDTQNLHLDVGGLDNLKRWLSERSKGFSAAAKAFGLPDPKGLFLLGVQGCGKSLMAKSVAKLWGFPLLRLDVAAVFQVSSGEEGLRDTIRIAESLSPVVLWIDELEKGFANDTNRSGEALGFFLTWMQEKTKPVFVVATANEVRALPPELLRKGRFDEIFFVDLPNPHERLEILDIHLRQRKRNSDDFDLTTVVEETERFSGAELEQVVISGLFRAFSEQRTLDTLDLLESAREIVPLAVTMDDQLKDLREWARPRARRASSDRRRMDFFADWDDRDNDNL